MKKQIVSTLLALCMLLCLMPTAAFAEDSTEPLPVCSCETPCTAENMNVDCAVCGAEGALPENCEKCAQFTDDAATQLVDSAETLPVCSCETPCTAENMNMDCAICGAEGALPENCEKCAQPVDDTAAQPEEEVLDAQPEEALAVLNGEGETVIELNQAYVDNSNDYNFNNFYVTLQGGKTYKLIENLVLDGKFLWVTPSSDSTAFGVTLDLNGHTLTIQNPVSLYDRVQGVRYYYDWQGNTRSEASPIGILVYTTYNENADRIPLTLTLTDSSDAKTGALDVQGTDATGIYVGRNCTLNIAGGTITNSTTVRDSAYKATGVQTVLGTVNMTGGTIENQAVGVLLRGGTFDMTNGTIENCGYLDDNGKPHGDGGVYAYAGYKEPSDATGIEGSNAHSSTLTMSGGTISNCMNVATGGGVSLDGGSMFTMKNGTITGCKAGERASSSSGHSGGGGVYVGDDGTFTMEGGTISGCEAVNHGGGVYAVGTFEMKGGTITNCTARAGGGVSALGYNVSATFTMSGNAEITGCKAVGSCGGGAYIGNCKFTMSDEAKITNCTATEDGGNVKDGDCIIIESADYATLDIADSVTISGQITQGFGGIRIDGLGSVKYPYQISTKDELVLFRDIVNGSNGQTQNRGACAELTADIALNNDLWMPIGPDQSSSYTGTFDGKGHTIKNLNVNSSEAYVGLFGFMGYGVISQNPRVSQYGAVRNLTVAGKVTGTGQNARVGGIAGMVEDGLVANCANLCTVENNGNGETGGIAGYVQCISGYQKSIVLIRDCYNVGTVTGANCVGGIAGQVDQPNCIFNCYNAGQITGKYTGEITASGSRYFSNCYYLSDTDTDSAARTAEEFADGTVLALLINGRAESEHPWAAECQYLAAAGKTLPVFKGQGDAHIHDQSSPWEHNETEHWQVCSCGAVFHKAAHSGGEATCTEKAACTTCGNKYGNVLGHDFTVRQYDNDNHWMKCSRCNATTGSSEHTWDSGKKTTSATCTKAGEKTYTCNVCNATKAESIQATGHSWKSEWTSDATHHWHECANDNCDVTDNSGKDGYAEHSGGTATCKDKAVCKTCGESYGSLDPNNHANLKHIDAKAATIAEEGNIEYWYCDACNKYFSDAAATKVITKADTVTAKLTETTTPQPTAEPQHTAQPQSTVQPQPTVQPTVQPVSPIPSTGDTANPVLWFALLIISGSALAAIVVLRRKSSRK